MQMCSWELKLKEKIRESDLGDDPAHDLAHFERVVATAKRIGIQEQARLEIVLPAAWLHDLIAVPKNDPRRSIASQLSADAAVQFLREVAYPSQFLEDIHHAIHAHSFSAQIVARTLEAKTVQDADRLDGLGAIGIARTFIVGGKLMRPIYHSEDPLCIHRAPDDQKFTIDHFYAKLFRVAESLQTASGREEGLRRVQFMRTYLEELAFEIKSES